jgi:hypothetical protein
MFRSIVLCLLAAAMTAACASRQPATSGGYYCIVGSDAGCPELEGYGDCQPCPSASLSNAGGTPGTLR